jgi:CheY-like chemotaxis protein
VTASPLRLAMRSATSTNSAPVTRTAFTTGNPYRRAGRKVCSEMGLARRVQGELGARAEVSSPVRSAPLRRVSGTVGGRRLWRCESGARVPDPDSRVTASGGSATGTARRVLVVDDERAIRLLCRFNLAASGIDVLEAENGLTALELARRERPDLVLLDVMMPDVDGWTVARELADDERTREIPIVFLTALADTADKRMGQQLGGVGDLVKPFDPVTIGDFVEDVLERVERGEREQLTRDISATTGQ